MAEEATPTPAAGPEPTTPPTPAADTQPPGKTFSEEYVKSLRAEAAKYRTEAQEAKTRAQEFEDRDKSEVQKLTGKLTKIEQERDEARAALVRYEVASEKNVPAKLVPLLTGRTREELEAQAALILENAKPADPDFDGGTREPSPPAQKPEDAHNEFLIGLLGGRT
jgi:hypothetical protein